jgi:sec-independent protein translocase protein TatA
VTDFRLPTWRSWRGKRAASEGARLQRKKEASMPFGLGMGELVIILVIVTVVFGATKLPALGDGMGKAIRNFKRSIEDNKTDVKDDENKAKLDTKVEGSSKTD